MCSVRHDNKQHGDSSGGVPAPLPVRTVPTLTVTVLLPAEAFRQLYHCGVSQQGTAGEVPAEWCSLTHLPLNINKCRILGSRKTRLQPVGSKKEGWMLLSRASTCGQSASTASSSSILISATANSFRINKVLSYRYERAEAGGFRFKRELHSHRTLFVL